MRYDAEHKSQSRRRIVEAARTLFRRHGLDAPSIDQIMGGAGLTRGAFYAHFSSREQLVHEVLSIEPGLVTDLIAANDRATASQVLSRYLEPAQRADVAHNCPLVAHPVDVQRGDEERRLRYGARLDALIEALGSGPAQLEDDAAVLVAVLTVGSALLSAAVADPDRADQLEAVASAVVRRILGERTDPEP